MMMLSFRSEGMLFFLIHNDILEEIKEYQTSLGLGIGRLVVCDECIDYEWGYPCSDIEEITRIFEQEPDVGEIVRKLSQHQDEPMRYSFLDINRKDEDTIEEIPTYYMDILSTVLDRARDF